MNDYGPFDIRNLLMFFWSQLPNYLAWMVGMILALMRWRRHPTVSLLSVIAFAVFLVVSLAVSSFGYLLPYWNFTGNWTNTEYDRYFLTVTIIHTVSGGAAWVLLLIALFGWRYPPLHIAYENEAREPERSPDAEIQKGRPGF